MVTRWKAVAAALGVVSTALTTAFADDVFDFSDAGTVVSSVVVGALSVYAVWRVPYLKVKD